MVAYRGTACRVRRVVYDNVLYHSLEQCLRRPRPAIRPQATCACARTHFVQRSQSRKRSAGPDTAKYIGSGRPSLGHGAYTAVSTTDLLGGSFGNCSSDSSREHIVTEAAFPGPELTVRGLPFLEGGPITIHKSQFRSNILCRKHNNSLSPVDQAGVDAFVAFRSITEGRSLGKKKIKGDLFERWLLKTLINLETVSNFNVRPPLELVERAFGRKAFPQNSGLFFLAKVDWRIPAEDRLTYWRMTSDVPDSNDIRGGRFTCNGFTFLLMLGAVVDPSSPVTFVDYEGATTDVIRPMHRPRRFNTSNPRTFVAFSWKGIKQ